MGEVFSFIDIVLDVVFDIMILEQKLVEMKSKSVVIGLFKEFLSNFVGLLFYVEVGFGQFVLLNDDNLINRMKINFYIIVIVSCVNGFIGL